MPPAAMRTSTSSARGACTSTSRIWSRCPTSKSTAALAFIGSLLGQTHLDLDVLGPLFAERDEASGDDGFQRDLAGDVPPRVHLAAGQQAERVGKVLSLVDHRPDDLFFVEEDRAVVERHLFLEHPQDDDLSTLAGGRDGRSKARRRAGGLQHQCGPQPLGALEDQVLEPRIIGLEHELGAVRPRQVLPRRVLPDGDDLARALGSRDQDGQEPDVPRTDHDHAVGALKARQVPAVDAHGRRFDQGGQTGGKLRWTPVELIGRQAHVFGECAVGAGAGDPAPHEIHTSIMVALAAVETGPAIERRLHDDLLPHAPSPYLGTQFGDLAAKLMPHDETGRPGVGTVEKTLHVTAADAGALDPDEDLAGLGGGIGHLGQTNVARTVKHRRTHGSGGAEDGAAGGVEQREGDGLTGGQLLGVGLEAGGEAKAFREFEEADGVGRLGGVTAGGDADDRPGEEAAAAREGDGASALAPAEGAGMARLQGKLSALGAATRLQHQSLPRIVTVLTTPVPPRLWASPIRAFRTWLAASPRSCFTSS